MPRYNFKCRDCKLVYESIAPVGTDTLFCVACDGVADKLPAAPNFKIEGYSAKNGYSK